MASYGPVNPDLEIEQPVQPPVARVTRARRYAAAACVALLLCAAAAAAVVASPFGQQPNVVTEGLTQEYAVKVPKLLPLASEVKNFPELCDKKIVLRTCERMNKDTPEFFDTKADRNVTVLHAAEIAGGIVSDRDSVIKFLKKIGAKNVETNKDALGQGAYAVSCKELCDRTVATFKDNVLPAKSDVACYKMPGEDPSCDVDVSPKSLSHVKLGHAHHRKSAAELGNLSKPEKNDYDLDDLEDEQYPERDEDFLRMMVAQMFRIHPLSSATFGGKVKEVQSTGRRLSNSDTCRYAKDNECDDGSKGNKAYCHHGTDCTDCGNCHSNVDTCRYAKDHECDEVEFCGTGTDCTDCGNCDGGNPVYQNPPPSTASSAVVRKSLQKLALAQAWASNALRKLGANQRSDLLRKWFRSSSSSVRSQAKNVAASAIGVINNCEFRSNQAECDKMPSVLAYVHPGEKNSQGQFIIFMCNHAMGFDDMTFLGTIYHEACHHPPARRDDVIYGRSKCQQLDTRSGLNNADNHEYFFEDLNAR